MKEKPLLQNNHIEWHVKIIKLKLDDNEVKFPPKSCKQ